VEDGRRGGRHRVEALVEMERAVHNTDSYVADECFRRSLYGDSEAYSAGAYFLTNSE
jgi:hypothetical protein